MKVNFSPISNFFNNRRLNKQEQPVNIPNGLESDTFVKSAENKQTSSFANLNDKYPALKKEMTEYIMKSPE